jgi:hypothetical protein
MVGTQHSPETTCTLPAGTLKKGECPTQRGGMDVSGSRIPGCELRGSFTRPRAWGRGKGEGCPDIAELCLCSFSDTPSLPVITMS